jgi:hypothetical protein
MTTLQDLLRDYKYTAQPFHDLEMLVKAFFFVRDHRYQMATTTQSPSLRVQIWDDFFSVEPWLSLSKAARATNYDEMIFVLQSKFDHRVKH